MKRRWLAMAMVAALMVPMAGSAQDAAKKSGGKPVAEIQKMTHDFGTSFQLDKYAHTFLVKNRGNADLIIEDVKPGCGCTAANFDKVVPPGKEGKIDLVIDGNKVHGTFSKATEVRTNDPDRKQFTLLMSGKIVPFVNVSPDGTVYLHGRPGEKIEKDLVITSNEKDLNFQVTGVTSNMDDKIKYSYAKGAKPGEYVVKVSKDPKLPIMSTYGTLKITSNSKKAPETTLQVHVMTKSSILLSPSVLNYGEVKFQDQKGPGTPSTKTLTVTKAVGKLKITEVTTSNPNFVAALEMVTPEQQYKVKVTFNPPTRRQGKQTESGEMIIHTDDPQEPTLRVQLVARSL